VTRKRGKQLDQDRAAESATRLPDQALPQEGPRSGRRAFLEGIGGVTATAVAAALLPGRGRGGEGAPSSSLLPLQQTRTGAVNRGANAAALRGAARADKAYEIRVRTALGQRLKPLVEHPTNGDETAYPNRIGNYTKGLPHNTLGEVDIVAYDRYFLPAVRTGAMEDFDRIPMGGTSMMSSPQSGLTFELAGMDPANFFQAPPPAFASAEVASEIAENYWMALTRDVPFEEYEGHPLIEAAIRDLSRFSHFRGPREIPVEMLYQPGHPLYNSTDNVETRGRWSFPLTPRVLFRGSTPEDLVGPYLSQFLLHDVESGAELTSRRIRTPLPGDDYLTQFDDWLFAQTSTGHATMPNRFDVVRRYIRNGRDLGEWVHADATFQAYLNAALILLKLGAPIDENNPYRGRHNQMGFAAFGPPHLLSTLSAVSTCALRAVWYQKWQVHRRTRPEEFAARIHNHLLKRATYPLHSEILESEAPQEVFRRHGTYLLPMAYPEGSPTHPSYGSGHAVVAGACVTVLKAWFDESWVLPELFVPSSDGLSLLRYQGKELTVGGELNKLASNIAFARNIAGVHWRSDAAESLLLGEAVAVEMMGDLKECLNEYFDGFTFLQFNGQETVI
jgi:membrane-associated phospholipid phosphatase